MPMPPTNTRTLVGTPRVPFTPARARRWTVLLALSDPAARIKPVVMVRAPLMAHRTIVPRVPSQSSAARESHLLPRTLQTGQATGI